jgi:antitoxin YefM
MDPVILAVVTASVNVVALVLLWIRDRARNRDVRHTVREMALATSAMHDHYRVLVRGTRGPSKADRDTRRTALEAEPHLADLVHLVREQHEPVTVTFKGRPSAVLLSVEDFRGLEETIDILSDPETMRRLAESDAELERGEVVTAEELAEAMHARKTSSQ